MLDKLTIISIDDHDLFRSGVGLIVRGNFPGVAFAAYGSLGEALERQAVAPMSCFSTCIWAGSAGVRPCRSSSFAGLPAR